MTSPTYEELPLDLRDAMRVGSTMNAVIEAVCSWFGSTDTIIKELQAENARLTGELDELLTRFLTLAARRDAAQEQVRQYAEAIEGVAAWGCDSPECVNDVCKVVRPIRQLAKNPPDGASALSGLEALKQTIESQASMMDGLREGSRTHAQGEREALSEVAKLRGLLRRLSEWDTMQTAGDGPFWKREIAAALGERSTSPEPYPNLAAIGHPNLWERPDGTPTTEPQAASPSEGEGSPTEWELEDEEARIDAESHRAASPDAEVEGKP